MPQPNGHRKALRFCRSQACRAHLSSGNHSLEQAQHGSDSTSGGAGEHLQELWHAPAQRLPQGAALHAPRGQVRLPHHHFRGHTRRLRRQERRGLGAGGPLARLQPLACTLWVGIQATDMALDTRVLSPCSACGILSLSSDLRFVLACAQFRLLRGAEPPARACCALPGLLCTAPQRAAMHTQRS